MVIFGVLIGLFNYIAQGNYCFIETKFLFLFWKPLIFFTKSSALDVCKDSEYDPAAWKNLQFLLYIAIWNNMYFLSFQYN